VSRGSFGNPFPPEDVTDLQWLLFSFCSSLLDQEEENQTLAFVSLLYPTPK
jgi:hypothetical protein